MSEKKTKCLIISTSNLQNVRIRCSLALRLKERFDETVFCGDGLFDGPISQISWKGASKNGGFLNELRILLRLVRIFFRFNPTHVIAYAPKPNIYCSLLAGFFGYKLVLVISGFGRNGHLIKPENRIIKKIVLNICRRADVVFTMNSSDHQFFMSDTFYRSRLVRIPSEGITPSDGEELRFPSSVRKILYLSRVMEEKGIFVLLAAFWRLHKSDERFTLDIAGENGLVVDKEQSAEFDRLVTHPAIRYHGVVDEDKKNSLIQSTDVVVLVSRYGEGLPMILLEAQLRGKLVITSSQPGCREALASSLSRCTAEFTAESIIAQLRWLGDLSTTDLRDMTKRASQEIRLKHDKNSVNDLILERLSEESFVLE